MKYLLIVMAAYLWGFAPLFAQKLSPEERSELKMELIQIRQDLTILKAWKNREKSLAQQLEKAQSYHQTLLNELDTQLDALENIQNSIEELNLGIRAIQLNHKNLFEKVVFKVQIQAAQRHPLDRFSANSPFFTVYPEGRLNLYLLGYFYHYQEAKAFSSWLNRRGASTYVVGFKKGKRVRLLYNYTQK